MGIDTRRDHGVFLVTINRPEARNALSRQMSAELIEAWRELATDPELRVAILSGAGGKAFCAGADLKEVGAFYASMTPIERRTRAEREPGLGGITRNLDPGKPIIAAIDGYCLGGGLELALSCDLRIATTRATFAAPEVKRGIIPGAGGTQRLPRAIPLAIAMEMLLTGDAIDADTALRYGLVNRVVDPSELEQAAMDLACKIAANAPLAVAAARTAALRGLNCSLEEGLQLEQLYAEPVRTSDDAAEGVQAFIERRKPEFRGK